MIAPYRTPIFERLAARSDCELLVVFEAATEPNRRWPSRVELPFPHTILRSRTLDLRRLAPDAYAFLHLPRSPLAELRRFGADAVVAAGGGIWSSPANLAALAARPFAKWAVVPSWESFERPRHEQSRPRRLAEPWVRRFIRSGDAWLAWGSRATRDVVRLGAVASRTVTAPQVALPLEPARAGEHPEREAAFLYVGHLTPRKGLPALLEAIDTVPGFELWIAGEGPLLGSVQAASARDPRIRYFGHVDEPTLAALYRRAAALVLPSLHEVWGLVVNEALAEGTPVIATDQVAAADDLVEEGVTGYTVPAGSAPALAAALRAVGAWTARQREACRARARELLDGYTFDVAAERIVEACSLGHEHRQRTRSRPR